MNCIILLFLLGSCGGWGNSCGSGRNNQGCGCGRNDQGCGCGGNGRGRDSERRNCEQGNCGGRDSGRTEDCGCAQNERESCEVPGMIPPPWQEYPPFPRRDNMERGNSECCEA